MQGAGREHAQPIVASTTSPIRAVRDKGYIAASTP